MANRSPDALAQDYAEWLLWHPEATPWVWTKVKSNTRAARCTKALELIASTFDQEVKSANQSD